MKKLAIVNVNLQFEILENCKTDQDILEFVENVELPKEYIEDSFEFVKVYVEDDKGNYLREDYI